MLEPFGQTAGRMSLHPAMDGESRPFIDSQRPKRPTPKGPHGPHSLPGTAVRMRKGGQVLA